MLIEVLVCHSYKIKWQHKTKLNYFNEEFFNKIPDYTSLTWAQFYIHFSRGYKFYFTNSIFPVFQVLACTVLLSC
jgi:hypothetical protein